MLHLSNSQKNQTIKIHNTGDQTRDFQYVKDAVRAYSLVITKDKRLSGEVFNIGTKKQTSIKELANLIKILSHSSSDIQFEEGRCADLMSLEADYTLIHAKTGWEPKYTLEEGLQRTIDWYKKLI